LDSALLYTLTQVLLYIAGAYACLFCIHTFTESHWEAYAVMLCALCVIPLGDFGRFVPILMQHRVESPIGYLERDGFLLQGPLTLTLGTVSVVGALGLFGAYISSGKRAFLIATSLVTALSAAFHPFEIFAIAAGISLTLLCLRRPLVS